MITTRDRKAIAFVEQFKIATTDTLSELFYPNIKIAQRRLRIIVENKELKRQRDNVTAQYYYYINKPKNTKHNLLLTNFYRELNKIANIEVFKKEYTVEDIRPDGLVVYKLKGKTYISFVEVEISNKGFDIEKYEKLFRSGKYKKHFNGVFPYVIAITNRSIPTSTLKIIKTDEEMQDLELKLKCV